MAGFERKHRRSQRIVKRRETPPLGRQKYQGAGDGMVVNDYDGTELFRLGSYGSTDPSSDDNRGLNILNSDANSIGSFNSDGISLGSASLGDVTSDNVVTLNRDTIVRFVDPFNGDDTNDGLAPITVADDFNRTTSSGAGNYGTLAAAITASATSITVTETSTPPSTPFYICIDAEIMTVTARSAGTPATYTVTRGVHGTTAVSHLISTAVVSTASDGYHVWTVEAGTASDFSTSAGILTIANNVSDEKMLRINAGGAIAEELLWEWSSGKAPSTGTMTYGAVLRSFTKKSTLAADHQGILVRAAFTTTLAVIKLQIYSFIDGALTQLATQDLPVNFAVNQKYWVRAQIYDVDGTTTIRAKMWQDGGTEPAMWSGSDGVTGAAVTTTVSDQTYVTDRGGQICMRSTTAAIANNPINVKMQSWAYQVLDLNILEADDSSTTASDAYYQPASTSGPYATLTQALRDLPAYNDGNFVVCMGTGQKGANGDGLTGVLVDPNVLLNGIVGSGSIIITGCNNYWIGGLQINGCNQDIIMSGITMSDTGGNDGNVTLLVNVSRYIEIYQCIFEGNSVAAQNIKFHQGSCGMVSNCQLHGATNSCVWANASSYVAVQNNTGTGGANSYRNTTSILQVVGTVPTGGFSSGTTALTITTGTGSSNTNISSTAAAPTTGAGSNPPTSSKTTKQWSASAGGTYGLSYGTWAGGDVTQGAYGGSQNHKGVWKLPSDVHTKLSGKTISSAYITITRRGFGGSSGAQSVYLCTVSPNAVTGGAPTVSSGPVNIGSLSWGQTKTFKISNASILSDLADTSTAYALGVFQSDGTPYVILSDSMKLKATYS